MQTCLIFNPSARGRKAEAFRSRVGSLFPTSVIRLTGGPGDARRMAAEAVREGFATIVAVGGDGTANEVVNGLADVPNGLATARLGIMPLGTINVFARELGMPLGLARAAKTVDAGRETTIDLGRAEFAANGEKQCRHFLQLAGAGLDARAVELVSWELKKKTGPLAYVAAGLQALRESQAAISVEGAEALSGELVLLGNGRYYGGNFAVFPKANLKDGALDLCILSKVNFWMAARAALGLATGNVHRFLAPRFMNCVRVTLRSTSRVGFQLDGEFAGELPVTFSVLPKVLRVIVP